VMLTEAGGYAPKGERVGTVTVRNLSTGETGRARALGGGLAKGRLDNPVRVERGESYSIANSGSVLKAEADGFIRATFGVGGGDWPFETRGHDRDRAELFALPHPWFGPRPSARVRLRARALRGAIATSRRARRVRVRVRGLVARRYLARAGRRVEIQARRKGGWRTVARLRLRRGGRFRGRARVRTRRGRRTVALRALVRGVGGSSPVRVRVR
jgi:hypothetical protein